VHVENKKASLQMHKTLTAAFLSQTGPNRDGKLFAVTYPVASIVGSMLVCMGGSTLLSLFLGMPLQGFKSDFGFWLSVCSWYEAAKPDFGFGSTLALV
jgi:hypothetical protein